MIIMIIAMIVRLAVGSTSTGARAVTRLQLSINLNYGHGGLFRRAACVIISRGSRVAAFFVCVFCVL